MIFTLELRVYLQFVKFYIFFTLVFDVFGALWLRGGIAVLCYMILQILDNGMYILRDYFLVVCA